MRAFVIRRLLSGVALIVFIPTATFFLAYSDPETIARNILGENAFPAQVQATMAELGLNRSLYDQYLGWAAGALTGDLGTSWFTSTPVADSLAIRAPVTISLVVVAVLVTGLVATFVGVVAAVRGGWLDRVLQVGSVVGFALPNFWLGLILVVIFAINLRVLPATGYVPPTTSIPMWLASITLPVTALALNGFAAATQQVRGGMKDVLEQDYIRTLRSRGLTGRSVLLKHALKNAAPAGLTVLSLQFITLLSGAVVIEKVFAIQGLGTLAVDATVLGDVPVLMGVVLVTTVLVVISTLVVDLAYGWVNPKVRVQ